jgi:hypothetical protein
MIKESEIITCFDCVNSKIYGGCFATLETPSEPPEANCMLPNGEFIQTDEMNFGDEPANDCVFLKLRTNKNRGD